MKTLFIFMLCFCKAPDQHPQFPTFDHDPNMPSIVSEARKSFTETSILTSFLARENKDTLYLEGTRIMQESVSYMIDISRRSLDPEIHFQLSDYEIQTLQTWITALNKFVNKATESKA